MVPFVQNIIVDEENQLYAYLTFKIWTYSGSSNYSPVACRGGGSERGAGPGRPKSEITKI